MTGTGILVIFVLNIQVRLSTGIAVPSGSGDRPESRVEKRQRIPPAAQSAAFSR
jgi:hypothetical protein